MFVQDDQIRFVTRDQSGWQRKELHHARARRSADVGCRDLARLGTSYEWGRRVCVELLLSVLFPICLDV
jgi:hypothetical protein